MFEHLIGPLSGRMVPVADPDYHHEKARVLAEVRPIVRDVSRVALFFPGHWMLSLLMPILLLLL